MFNSLIACMTRFMTMVSIMITIMMTVKGNGGLRGYIDLDKIFSTWHVFSWWWTIEARVNWNKKISSPILEEIF